ncbi:MAG: GntR family transcriptional regulator [Nocardia sp.]|nr:GntR family transcriptional regulator [Nocardia sp.]
MTAEGVSLRTDAEARADRSPAATSRQRTVRKADRARQVADVLRQQIHTGRCPDPLPAEADLATEFAVSRNAVREALALLRDEGLIGRAPRVGTYVAQRKYDHGLDRLRGLRETLRGHGEVRNEIRAAVRLTPPPAVAARLGLEPGESAVYLERLRYLGDLPLSLDHTYLAPDIGARVLECDLRSEDVFALIERLSGQQLGSADLAVEAITADAHSAAILQAPEGSALLLLERLTHLADGRPVDLEYIRMRGDRITLRNSVVRASEGNDWRLDPHGFGRSAG